MTQVKTSQCQNISLSNGLLIIIWIAVCISLRIHCRCPEVQIISTVSFQIKTFNTYDTSFCIALCYKEQFYWAHNRPIPSVEMLIDSPLGKQCAQHIVKIHDNYHAILVLSQEAHVICFFNLRKYGYSKISYRLKYWFGPVLYSIFWHFKTFKNSVTCLIWNGLDLFCCASIKILHVMLYILCTVLYYIPTMIPEREKERQK